MGRLNFALTVFSEVRIQDPASSTPSAVLGLVV